jgi:hypothetical protein
LALATFPLVALQVWEPQFAVAVSQQTPSVHELTASVHEIEAALALMTWSAPAQV